MIMTLLDWIKGCSDSRTPGENSRPTPLKHLHFSKSPKKPAHLRPRHAAGPWPAPPNRGPGCRCLDGGRARRCPDAPPGGRDVAEVVAGGLATRPHASPHMADDGCPLSSPPRHGNVRARCQGASLLMTVSYSLHREPTACRMLGQDVCRPRTVHDALPQVYGSRSAPAGP
jgi:hypothetical protein